MSTERLAVKYQDSIKQRTKIFWEPRKTRITRSQQANNQMHKKKSNLTFCGAVVGDMTRDRVNTKKHNKRLEPL
jgi:hypothetical protein